MTAEAVRLLLAEDQAMVRGALAALLNLEDDMAVVAEVGRGDEVVEAARAANVHVALLDIEMPGLTGLEAADALHRALPEVKIVILTTFGRPGFLRRAMGPAPRPSWSRTRRWPSSWPRSARCWPASGSSTPTSRPPLWPPARTR